MNAVEERSLNIVNDETLPKLREKWLGILIAGEDATKRIQKVQRNEAKAKGEAERANIEWQAILADRDRLQLAINRGEAAKGNLLYHLPPDMASVLNDLEEKRLALFAEVQELRGKVSRASNAVEFTAHGRLAVPNETPERPLAPRLGEWQSRLKAAEKGLAAIDQELAATRARLLAEAWPNPTEAQRAGLFDKAKRLTQAAWRALLGEQPRYASQFGTSESPLL